jgi:hypothetical protein
VLNRTGSGQKDSYRCEMSQEPTQATAVDQSFDERWAAWQARGAANDHKTQRGLFIVVVIFLLASALLGGFWLLA